MPDEIKIKEKYQYILCRGIGLDVLADILVMCHFGSSLDLEDKHQVAEHNVGVAILAKCGIFGNPKVSMESIVRALSSLPLVAGSEGGKENGL